MIPMDNGIILKPKTKDSGEGVSDEKVMEFKPHISVKNLNIFYDGHHALKNITADIPEKNITTIIGPSGCGKTTLLKSLNRLLELQDGVKITGEILLHGENIYSNRMDVFILRKKIGLLSQKPYPLPMSIYDNIAYGLRVHGLREKKYLNEKVEHYLKEAGLWNEVRDRLSTSASKLSIGQQQRLCLARGLAVEPEIILADEPTSSLDPVSAEHIEKKLLELKKRYTVIMVTHNIQQAMRIADCVIFLYLGQLIENDSADNVCKRPKEEITSAYIKGEFLDEIWAKREFDLSKKGAEGEGI
jgi:phosphate transport system ATP-binding protein